MHDAFVRPVVGDRRSASVRRKTDRRPGVDWGTWLGLSAALVACLTVVVHGQWWSALLALATALASAGGVWVLWTRIRRDHAEIRVWKAFASALAAAAAGMSGHAVLVTLGALGVTAPADIGRIVTGTASLAVCWWTYQGLINWNRYRTQVTDPSDWMNGLSSVFAALALGNLLVHTLHAPMAHWPSWQLQLWLAQVGAGTVVFLTGPTVARLACLAGDVRVWATTGAFAAMAVVPAVTGASPPEFVGHLRYGLLGLAIAAVSWSARRPSARVHPQISSAQALTAGAMFILFAAVSVLVLHAELDTHKDQYAIVFAVLAALGVTGRIARLVKDLAQLAQTRHEALTDELTGIPNRRALIKHLQQDRSGDGRVSLLIIDLDQFKAINDRFGHAVGDRVLQHLTARIGEITSPQGFLARLGGDEFAAVFDHAGDTGRDRPYLAATEILSAAGKPIVMDGRRLQLGASIGIATMPLPATGTGDRIDDGELLRRADVAMYQAKTAGGGVREYDSVLAGTATRRAQLTDELCALLGPDAKPGAATGRIVAFYQPQVDTVTGLPTGVEALVRWAHPELGLLTPNLFLDIVEEAGLMGAMTAHILAQAVWWARARQARGEPLRVSVNLSTSCLTNPDLLPCLDDLLGSSKLDPRLLVLEVTETGIMHDPEAALAKLHQIRERGVQISIDDYGTGYSSLSYLNTLPADELKLDRSFLTEVLTDPRTRAIIRTTISLAHELGLRLVAEGVEDQATLLALCDMECDETQGYLHSEPRPEAELNSWIAQRVSNAGRQLRGA